MKTKTITLFLTICLASFIHCFSQNSPVGDQFGLGRTYIAVYTGGQEVTIDAVADEPFWDLTPYADMDTIVAGSMHETPLTSEDFTGQFKLAWDENNLYIYVTVTDDVIVSGPGGITSDNMEIFFNTDSLWFLRDYNDSEDAWRDPYRPNKGYTASQIRANVINQLDVTGGGYAIGMGNDVEYDFLSVETDAGFDMEIKLPFEYIINPDANILHTFKPEDGEGQVLFFDIGYGDVDDDDVGQREHIIHWNASNPDPWKDVRHFGRIVLGPADVNASKEPLPESLRIYPSFTSGRITLELPDYQQCSSITISSVIGRKMIHTSHVDRVNHFDLHELPAGIYLLSVEKSSGFISTGKIVKQD